MNMLEWAENEVKIACEREAPCRKDDEWDYGCACYESALKAYKSLLSDEHSGFSFSLTKQILNRLMDRKPLTPIEDIPENWNLVCREDNGIEEYQCKRMSSLFKDVYPDGKVKVYDVDRYYCIDLKNPKIPYTGGGASRIVNEMFPITFPYYPPNGKFKVAEVSYLTDRANGDFDTKMISSITAPDGTKWCVDRYFGEVDGEWKEIEHDEYIKRVNLHYEREAKEKCSSTN